MNRDCHSINLYLHIEQIVIATIILTAKHNIFKYTAQSNLLLHIYDMTLVYYRLLIVLYLWFRFEKRHFFRWIIQRLVGLWLGYR